MQKYILLTSLLASLLFLFTCTKRKAPEFLQELLQTTRGIDESRIKDVLYEFQSKQGTVGRAVYLGSRYFLTAYHVIENQSVQMMLIHQSDRGRKKLRVNYRVLHHDRDLDIALILSSDYNNGSRPVIAIENTKLQPGRKLSQFTHLTGVPITSDYHLNFDGKDYYNQSKTIRDIAGFRLSAKSFLFEKHGLVLKYNPKEIWKITKAQAEGEVDASRRALHNRIHAKPEGKMFTSLPLYDGESGSAIFAIQNHQFKLAGVLIASYQTNEVVKTPKHPLGYSKYIRSNTITSTPSGLRSFFKTCIKKLTQK